MGAAASPVSGQSLERAGGCWVLVGLLADLGCGCGIKANCVGVATDGLEACTVLSTLIRMLS